MSEQALLQFAERTYLNLETYRRDGRPIRTTVWFVLDRDAIWIRTLNDSGKTKRMAGNAKVRVVPSSFFGKPLGNWTDATAELIGGKEALSAGDLFRRKYGIQKGLTDIATRIRGRNYVVYRLTVGQ